MYRRTEEGAVIDPPIIPAYETAIYAAQELADQDEMDRLNAEYTKARTSLADKRDAHEKRKTEDAAAADAEAREIVRNRKDTP